MGKDIRSFLNVSEAGAGGSKIAKSTNGASSSGATAHASSNSLLGSLMHPVTAPKPAAGLDNDSLSALSVFKSSKRGGGSGRSGNSLDIDDDDNGDLEISLGGGGRDGGGRTGKRPRSSAGSSGNSSSRSSVGGHSHHPKDRRSGSFGSFVSSVSSNRYRNRRFIDPNESGEAGTGANDGRSVSSMQQDSASRTGVVASKMGPWAKRPGQRAVCEEDGYDPLTLLEDANEDLFGNRSFRGVQRDVSEAIYMEFDVCPYEHFSCITREADGKDRRFGFFFRIYSSTLYITIFIDIWSIFELSQARRLQ